MNDRGWIDFKELAQQVQTSLVGSGGVTLRSGACVEAEAIDLLRAWRAANALPFGLWEELSAVRIDRDLLPPTAWPLLRARLFGPGGDLDLWRVEGSFGWRFVGPPGAALPQQERCQGIDFWQQPGNAGARFFRSTSTYLLWGKRQADGVWREDRVAASALRYPLEDGEQESERVQVRSELYSRGGLVEFVWHQKLEGYHG